MDFSPVDAATTCMELSQAASQIAHKIPQLMAAGSVGDGALQKQLATFSARLQSFRQHVDQLAHCLSDAAVIHPDLADVLKSGLADCRTALETVPAKLEPGSGGLSVDAVACFETLAKASLRFFILATQLLNIETDHEQQAKLAHPAAQAIVDTARKASQSVLSFSYVTEN